MKKLLQYVSLLTLLSSLSFSFPHTNTKSLNVTLSGTVHTASNQGIEAVSVRIIGGGIIQQTTTDVNGDYSFTGIADNQTYVITLEKDLNPLNGVSTFDLVLISKHITNNQLLSTYDQLAADVNGDDKIDVADMLYIRQLILNITNTFPNGMTSWGFVPANYIFGTTGFPNPFPNSVTSVNVNGNTSADFIGFKRGDVNGSAIP